MIIYSQFQTFYVPFSKPTFSSILSVLPFTTFNSVIRFDSVHNKKIEIFNNKSKSINICMESMVSVYLRQSNHHTTELQSRTE